MLNSGLLGENQASQMLKGKDYENDIQLHLYLVKTINKTKLEAFRKWFVTRNECRIYKEMKENVEVQKLKQSKNTESFEWRMKELRTLLKLYEKFEQLLSNSEECTMTTFWNLYLDIIQTLLDFTKSIKNRS